MSWLYYAALIDGAGELRTCQIRAALKLEGTEKLDEMSKALVAHFGTVRQFVQVIEVVEPAVTILLEGGSVKSTYSSQSNMKVEVFDLDLRSDGTTELEQKVRAGIPGHMVEVEALNHFDKTHA
jgi:hypothetical protein